MGTTQSDICAILNICGNEHTSNTVLPTWVRPINQKKEGFAHYNREIYDISNSQMMAMRLSGGDGMIFGNIRISSTSKFIHKWKFKVHDEWYAFIGISKPDYRGTNRGAFLQTIHGCKLYILEEGGVLNRWDESGDHQRNDNLSFSDGDTVEMELDLALKTLSYTINNGEKQKAFENIYVANNVTYSMIVGFTESYGQQQIELISYDKIVS
eukprot:35843_1